MSTILITGANKGIGLQITAQYANQGHQVIACCRQPDSATELHKLKESHQIQIMELAVGETESVANLAKALKGKPIDILINNAGTSGPSFENQTAMQMDFEGWADAFNINAMAPVRVMHALTDNVKASSAGKIATITSQMGALSLDMAVAYAYCSSKAALNKYMKMAALEYVKKGVALCVIHPGWVQTDMGGPSADITAEQSAAGIIDVIDKLDMSNAGGFFKWDGDTHEW